VRSAGKAALQGLYARPAPTLSSVSAGREIIDALERHYCGQLMRNGHRMIGSLRHRTI